MPFSSINICDKIIMKIIIITYLLRPRETVFCGPETAVVARAEVEGNNDGRGATKHTAMLSRGLSK
jgi:hypothetical protein